LLLLLGLANPVVSLYENQTTQEQAEQEAQMNTFFTGKGDINQVMTYYAWHNMSALPAGKYWAEDVGVTGTTGFQFAPFLDDDDLLYVWVEELLRPMDLVFTDDVTEKGIDLLQYRLGEDNFLDHDIYYQSIPGFGNMSIDNNGVPIFLSKPRFLDCPAEWRDKVAGVVPNDEADDTFINVEPITGVTMDACKQLQVNMFLDPTTSPLDLWNKQVPTNTMYPMFFVSELAAITDKLADDFKNKVYQILTIRTVIFWTFLSVGIFMVVVGIVLIAYVIFRNRQMRGYQILNDL